MINVENTINIYEIDGVENKKLKNDTFKIVSHWNRNEMVVIEIDGQQKLTVCKSDLIAAIDNATNISRY